MRQVEQAVGAIGQIPPPPGVDLLARSLESLADLVDRLTSHVTHPLSART
jgi:hypothetical protein